MKVCRRVKKAQRQDLLKKTIKAKTNLKKTKQNTERQEHNKVEQQPPSKHTVRIGRQA